jgi:uncharacterized protein (DUF1501 family)
MTAFSPVRAVTFAAITRLLIGSAIYAIAADPRGALLADLYQNRELKPTADLRAVLKGVLKDHLRAAERVLAQNVFPGSDGVKPVARSVG